MPHGCSGGAPGPRIQSLVQGLLSEALSCHRSRVGGRFRFSCASRCWPSAVRPWPTTLRAKFYDGITRPQPDSEGKLTWPADISEMRVWFLDPVVPPKGDNAKARPEKPEAEKSK